jgi:hypothetical protein
MSVWKRNLGTSVADGRYYFLPRDFRAQTFRSLGSLY